MLSRVLLMLVISGLATSSMAASIATYAIKADNKQAPPTMTVYLDKGYALVKNAGNRNTDMLFRAADRTLFIINHDRKSYIEMNPTIMKKTVQQISGMMAALQAQLQNLPAAQRKKMQQMLGGAGGSTAPKRPATLQKTGKTARYAGIRCQQYIITSPSQKNKAQACFSTEQAAGLSRAESDTLRALYRFGEQMAKSASNLLGKNNPTAFLPKGGLPGVLLYSKRMQGSADEIKLLSVEHKAVAASLYRTPAGYRKMTLPGVGG